MCRGTWDGEGLDEDAETILLMLEFEIKPTFHEFLGMANELLEAWQAVVAGQAKYRKELENIEKIKANKK